MPSLKSVLLSSMLLCLQGLVHAAPATTTPPASDERAASPVALAQEAAKSWLVEVDGDQYGKSWDRAASLFQNEVTREKWETSMIRVRGMLGSAEQRKLVSSSLKHSLPGMPDGDYVVMTYATKFEHKARALEVITPMKEKDGKWKVAGYVIK